MLTKLDVLNYLSSPLREELLHFFTYEDLQDLYSILSDAKRPDSTTKAGVYFELVNLTHSLIYLSTKPENVAFVEDLMQPLDVNFSIENGRLVKNEPIQEAESEEWESDEEWGDNGEWEDEEEDEEDIDVDDLLGKTITSYKIGDNNERLILETLDGFTYVLFHEQDCCETVKLYDIAGDMNNLLNEPLCMAEEVTDKTTPIDEDYALADHGKIDSYTWTYYKFATRKGYVTLRWLGTSNGSYSERVKIQRLR